MTNISRIKLLFKLPDLLQTTKTNPKCQDTLNYGDVLHTLGGRTYRWRAVCAHSPDDERLSIVSCKPRQTRRGGVLRLDDIPSSHSRAPAAQVGTPGGGPSGPAQFSPTMVVVGGCCPDSKRFKFYEAKNPRTGAENQEDPKSRTEGTKWLSSSPGDLKYPRQGDRAGFWTPLPPGRVATRKRRKPQYSNICQSD